MYIYIYKYICVCGVCVCVYVYIRTHIHIYIYMYVCVYIHIFIYIYMYIYIRIYVYTYVKRAGIDMCLCVCVFAYTYGSCVSLVRWRRVLLQQRLFAANKLLPQHADGWKRAGSTAVAAWGDSREVEDTGGGLRPLAIPLRFACRKSGARRGSGFF